MAAGDRSDSAVDSAPVTAVEPSAYRVQRRERSRITNLSKGVDRRCADQRIWVVEKCYQRPNSLTIPDSTNSLCCPASHDRRRIFECVNESGHAADVANAAQRAGGSESNVLVLVGEQLHERFDGARVAELRKRPDRPPTCVGSLRVM